MRDTRRVDDLKELHLGAPGLEPVEQSHAATEHDRHQVDGQNVEQAGAQALLNDRGSHQAHVLAGGSRPRFLDGTFDTIGDEGIGRLTGRHRFWDAMGDNEQGNTWQWSLPAPRVRDVVRPAPRDDRAVPAGERIEKLRAGG